MTLDVCKALMNIAPIALEGVPAGWEEADPRGERGNRFAEIVAYRVLVVAARTTLEAMVRDGMPVEQMIALLRGAETAEVPTLLKGENDDD